MNPVLIKRLQAVHQAPFGIAFHKIRIEKGVTDFVFSEVNTLFVAITGLNRISTAK